jgi:hypothetical protein
MSNLIEQLGLDPDNVKWYQLAACSGTDINMFYDDYESDKYIAEQIDQVCLHCPVIKQCYNEGVENKEKGVWGGIYMDLGRIDKEYNSHKTTDIWKRLKSVHGSDLLHKGNG